MDLLFQIEKELSKAYNINELLPTLMNLMTKVLNVDRALFFLSDKSEKTYTLRWAENIDIKKIGEPSISVESGLLAKVLKSESIYVVNEYNEQDEFLSKQLKLKINNIMSR